MNRREFAAYSAAAAATITWPARVIAKTPVKPVFQFRSGFWQNLHHTLYYQAQVLQTVYGAGAQKLAQIDRAAHEDLLTATKVNESIWFRALRIYQARYASKSFVFDDALMKADNAISGDAAQPLPQTLPAPMGEALRLAAPVYSDALWAKHDASNRAFINNLEALVSRYHDELAIRLTRVYATPWLDQPYVVDAVQYAQWNGSYSNNASDFVHIVMSVQDPLERALGALDILYHEASHSIADSESGTIGGTITAAAAKLNRPAPNQFWHAVIMYVPGKIMEELAAAEGTEYTMVWMQPGLFGRAWSRYYDALQRHFQPYIHGIGTLDVALATSTGDVLDLKGP